MDPQSPVPWCCCQLSPLSCRNCSVAPAKPQLNHLLLTLVFSHQITLLQFGQQLTLDHFNHPLTPPQFSQRPTLPWSSHLVKLTLPLFSQQPTLPQKLPLPWSTHQLTPLLFSHQLMPSLFSHQLTPLLFSHQLIPPPLFSQPPPLPHLTHQLLRLLLPTFQTSSTLQPRDSLLLQLQRNCLQAPLLLSLLLHLSQYHHLIPNPPLPFPDSTTPGGTASLSDAAADNLGSPNDWWTGELCRHPRGQDCNLVPLLLLVVVVVAERVRTVTLVLFPVIAASLESKPASLIVI